LANLEHAIAFSFILLPFWRYNLVTLGLNTDDVSQAIRKTNQRRPSGNDRRMN
jgi:hypothetical protein